MTLAQITFLALWPLLSLIAIIAIYKDRKYDGKQRVLFSIVFLIFPILAALLYLLVTYSSHVFFWSNSATKDKAWLAESDINHGSSGDDFSSGGD